MVLMFTDVVGSVALKTHHGTAVYREPIARHDAITRRIITALLSSYERLAIVLGECNHRTRQTACFLVELHEKWGRPDWARWGSSSGSCASRVSPRPNAFAQPLFAILVARFSSLQNRVPCARLREMSLGSWSYAGRPE